MDEGENPGPAEAPCPECGAATSDADALVDGARIIRRCPACGLEFEPGESDETEELVLMDDDEPDTCPTCGLELDREDLDAMLEDAESFGCPGCGAELTTCDDCAAVIPDTNDPCPACGAIPPAENPDEDGDEGEGTE